MLLTKQREVYRTPLTGSLEAIVTLSRDGVYEYKWGDLIPEGNFRVKVKLMLPASISGELLDELIFENQLPQVFGHHLYHNWGYRDEDSVLYGDREPMCSNTVCLFDTSWDTGFTKAVFYVERQLKPLIDALKERQ